MKEITKNQATAIWQIFFVLWLTVGSIVCFNIHCITSEPPIYTYVCNNSALSHRVLFWPPLHRTGNSVSKFCTNIDARTALVFNIQISIQKQKIRKYNYSYSYDSRHRFVSILRLIFYNRIFFHIQSLFSIVSVLHNQFNNKNRINFCNG